MSNLGIVFETAPASVSGDLKMHTGWPYENNLFYSGFFDRDGSKLALHRCSRRRGTGKTTLMPRWSRNMQAATVPFIG